MEAIRDLLEMFNEAEQSKSTHNERKAKQQARIQALDDYAPVYGSDLDGYGSGLPSLPVSLTMDAFAADTLTIE